MTAHSEHWRCSTCQDWTIGDWSAGICGNSEMNKLFIATYPKGTVTAPEPPELKTGREFVCEHHEYRV